MDNVRIIKKRQWRPRRPDDQQPRARNQIRLNRLDDPLKVVQRTEPKLANDRYHWSKQKCEATAANKQNSVVQQQLADKTQTKADISQLSGFFASSVWSPYKMKDIEKLEGVQRRSTKQLPGMKDISYPERLVKLNLPTLAYRRIRGDMIEVYKIISGKHDQDTNSILKPWNSAAARNSSRGNSRKIFPERSRTNVRKNFFSQRVVNKRSFSDGKNGNTTVQTSDVIKKSRHTCDDKPVINNSKTTFCSPVKEHSSVKDSVHCDIKHRTVLGPAIKPPCSTVEKRSVAEFESSDDDFDYSLDLMGEYTLKISDHAKEPTPFWFESVPVKQSATLYSETDQRPAPKVSLDVNCLHSQLFTPEVNLGMVLDTPQDVGEFDTIMNSRRGYTYINYSKYRGTKRRIAFDDEEDLIPHKMSRTC